MSLHYEPASELLRISVKQLFFIEAAAAPLCVHATGVNYRVTSLIRNSLTLGPYSRTMPRALWQSKGGGGYFL